MWWLSFCIARIAHRTNYIIGAGKSEYTCFNGFKVSIIMDSPFRPKNHNYIPTHLNIAAIQHQTSNR